MAGLPRKRCDTQVPVLSLGNNACLPCWPAPGAGEDLAILASQAPLPVSTPVIHASLQPPCEGWPHTACWDRPVDYTAVYRTLNRLARAGQVEKWPPGKDRLTCLWRQLTVPGRP